MGRSAPARFASAPQQMRGCPRGIRPDRFRPWLRVACSFALQKRMPAAANTNTRRFRRVRRAVLLLFSHRRTIHIPRQTAARASVHNLVDGASIRPACRASSGGCEYKQKSRGRRKFPQVSHGIFGESWLYSARSSLPLHACTLLESLARNRLAPRQS